jgi:hypothetical protein
MPQICFSLLNKNWSCHTSTLLFHFHAWKSSIESHTIIHFFSFFKKKRVKYNSPPQSCTPFSIRPPMFKICNVSKQSFPICQCGQSVSLFRLLWRKRYHVYRFSFFIFLSPRRGQLPNWPWKTSNTTPSYPPEGPPNNIEVTRDHINRW